MALFPERSSGCPIGESSHDGSSYQVPEKHGSRARKIRQDGVTVKRNEAVEGECAHRDPVDRSGKGVELDSTFCTSEYGTKSQEGKGHEVEYGQGEEASHKNDGGEELGDHRHVHDRTGRPKNMDSEVDRGGQGLEMGQIQKEEEDRHGRAGEESGLDPDLRTVRRFHGLQVPVKLDNKNAPPWAGERSVYPKRPSRPSPLEIG